MNAVVQQNLNGLAPLSSRAVAYINSRREILQEDDLGSGIAGGFGVISYKGKVWRIKVGGQEAALMTDFNGQQVPVPMLNLVILRQSPNLSKTWYQTGYVEGSNEAPDCFSLNGMNADPSSPKPQGSRNPDGSNSKDRVCALCPHNQFGSRVGADGQGRGKACADVKRLAVVPLDDIDNESNGGPMLLRIPAASLKNIKDYGDKLKGRGYPYFAVGTMFFFDAAEAYPNILFKPARVLSDEEFDRVLALRDDPRTLRILEAPEVPASTTSNASKPDDGWDNIPPVNTAASTVQQAAAAPLPAQQAATIQQPVQQVAPQPEPAVAAVPPGMTPEVYAQFLAFQAQQAAAPPAQQAALSTVLQAQQPTLMPAQPIQAAQQAVPTPSAVHTTAQPEMPASDAPEATDGASRNLDEMLDAMLG